MSEDAYPAIGDYGVIGNCHVAALVSSAGSIDWLCVSRFDSPSVFAAILDTDNGGRFAVSAEPGAMVSQCYFGRTAVLQRSISSPSGEATVHEIMAIADDIDHPHVLVRRLECIRGEVRFKVVFDPRPSYGAEPAEIHIPGPGIAEFSCDGHLVRLVTSGWGLAARSEGGLEADLVLRAGQRSYALMSWERHDRSLLRRAGDPDLEAEALFQETVSFWRGWISQSKYRGPNRAVVERSAITLKMLTHRPTGAIVAAPTTSLPEAIGGSRNWDYRYCWLRDASFTVDALFSLGYRHAGQEFFNWLAHTHAAHRSRFQIMYAIDGHARIPERTLDHFQGYRGSAPVRVGNAASGQIQLDIYGEVMDAAFLFHRHGGEFDASQAELLKDMADIVCEVWPQPDNGIWEVRGGRQHFTYSKVMCWVALDRALRLFVEADPERRQRWTAARAAIHAEVLDKCFNAELGAFTQAYESADLDATGLMIALVGFLPAEDPRVVSTIRAIEQHLTEAGLVYRYRSEDGLEGGEGTFTICSLWLVSALALIGEVERAEALYERILSYASPLGLYSEEIDPHSGDLLGNFPQAFTHIALIAAALDLEAANGKSRISRLPSQAVSSPRNELT